MSVSELIEAVLRRKSAYSEELTRVSREREQYESSAGDLERQRERNGLEMAGYLLPDLDDDDLAALEKRLRYPVFIAAKRKTEVELAALDLERVTIEADPRFRDRDVNRVDCDTQLAEIADAAASFKVEREQWEDSPHFQALHRRGWFAPDYDGGLFDWLRDWRACSLLMEHLETVFPERKFPDDDDVKQGWAALYESSEPVLSLQRDLQQRLAEIATLEARHTALLAAPEALFQALWKRLAQLIVDHLRASPEELLIKLAASDETLATFLKKDAGLKKQAVYLRQLIVTRIEPHAKRLSDEVRKLDRKGDKLRYKRARGKWIRTSQAEIAAYRQLPTHKWDTRRDAFEKTRVRVHDFNRWDRGHFVEDFLWWDLVTRGARADDLYEVRTFHERHPGWSVASFRDPLDDHHDVADANDLAAAAAVDSMMSNDDGAFDVS